MTDVVDERNTDDNVATVLANSSARDLARWVLEYLGEPTGPVNVEDVAQRLGIRSVIHDASQKRAGGLEIRDKRLVIVHGSSDVATRNATVAHELGHYLLRQRHHLSFRSQLGVASVERFCDDFSRELLIPHSWLEARVPELADLNAILEVSELAESPLGLAASAVLSEDNRWPAFLLVWQPRRAARNEWLVRHCVTDAPATYRGDLETFAALSRAVDEARVITIPIWRNNRLCEARAEMVRVGHLVATLISRLRVMPAGAHARNSAHHDSWVKW